MWVFGLGSMGRWGKTKGRIFFSIWNFSDFEKVLIDWSAAFFLISVLSDFWAPCEGGLERCFVVPLSSSMRAVGGYSILYVAY